MLQTEISPGDSNRGPVACCANAAIGQTAIATATAIKIFLNMASNPFAICDDTIKLAPCESCPLWVKSGHVQREWAFRFTQSHAAASAVLSATYQDYAANQ